MNLDRIETRNPFVKAFTRYPLTFAAVAILCGGIFAFLPVLSH